MSKESGVKSAEKWQKKRDFPPLESFMAAVSDFHHAYRFGEFTLDLGRGALTRDGEEVRLRPKSFAVLCHVVERHGRLVSKDELLEAIWGHLHVTEDSLTQCLIEIRRALGDEFREIVRTVPRRGYIFELPVILDGGQPGTEPGENSGA